MFTRVSVRRRLDAEGRAIAILFGKLAAIIVAMTPAWRLAPHGMTLGKPWMAALGKTREQIINGGSTAVTPFILMAAMQLVSAYFLARLTPIAIRN